MYLKVLFVLTSLAGSHCLNGKETGNHCDFLKLWLESTSLSVKIEKRGFHREVATTVEFRPAGHSSANVLLVYRWPRGVFVDPYQLESLKNQSDWQALLDSTIDLEEPAHKASRFVTYVYPYTDNSTPRRVEVTIPIHGRYHEPSAFGKAFTSIEIPAPDLLLRNSKCLHFDNVEPHTVVDAPCTVDDTSMCSWVKVQHHQKHEPLSFQLPVGDGSMVVPVCAGTLLVTMMCCAVLSKYLWTHQIIS